MKSMTTFTSVVSLWNAQRRHFLLDKAVATVHKWRELGGSPVLSLSEAQHNSLRKEVHHVSTT